MGDGEKIMPGCGWSWMVIVHTLTFPNRSLSKCGWVRLPSYMKLQHPEEGLT